MQEPLCGWKWQEEHKNDHADWEPRIEISRPGSKQTFAIKSKAAEKEVVKAIKDSRKGVR